MSRTRPRSAQPSEPGMSASAPMSGLAMSAPMSGLAMSAPISGLALSVLMATLLCVDGFSLHEGTVRYKLVRSLRHEVCQVCLGDHCAELDDPRCRFHEETTAALTSLAGGDSLALGEEAPSPVEALVHDMMQQGAASWITQECIPYVSQYTDCDKDNICEGCKTCACDGGGRWSCQQTQRCTAELQLNVDHHVLELVIQALQRDQLARKKRSIPANPGAQVTSVPQKLEYAEIMEWFYDVRHTAKDKRLDGQAPRRNGTMARPAAFTTPKPYDGIPDYLDFDEVLNNVMDDKDKHVATVKQSHVEYSKDYMDLDDIPIAKNDNAQFVHILNAIEEGNETSTDIKEESSTRRVTTKAVVEPLARDTGKTDLTMNLINDENNNDDLNDIQFDAMSIMKREITNDNIFDDNYNDTFGFNETRMKIDDEYYSEVDNDTIPLDAVNIMKREISSAQINLTTEVTTETINNSTSSGCLKNNVLKPLTKIINDKEQELKDLIRIKENLIDFIRNFNDTIEFNATRQEILTSTVMPNFKLDVYSEIQYNLRKINPGILDKLLYKLKRDIYEVIKDIVGLKKITTTNDLPDDLKALIRAMSLYVRKQKNSTSFENTFKLKYFRRLLLEEEAGEMYNSTRDYMIKILETLDKNKPKSDALISLSKMTNKIVRRVINNKYVDDLSAFGMRVYEPGYNVTNDFIDIGKKLQSMTTKVVASNNADKLYALKLLHLTVSLDIRKLTDAYTLIDFADTRRMTPIDGNMEQKLLDDMLNTFKQINEKTDSFFKNKTLAQNLAIALEPNLKEHKKKSFLRKIRNLLRGSRNDINELVRQQVPKKEIVQTIAKKRLGELSKKRFHNIMTKWQSDLNVISRQRRSTDVRKSRMNNIIPKYLRGKLSPALFTNKVKKEHQTMHTPPSKPQQVTQKITALKKKGAASKNKPKNKDKQEKSTPAATSYHLNHVEVLKPQLEYV